MADVGQMSRDVLPALLVELAALQCAVAARLAEPTPPPAPLASPAREKAPRWLSVPEVAERLGRDHRYVYRRAATWPFTVKDGKRLAFEEAGLVAWMERQLNGDR